MKADGEDDAEDALWNDLCCSETKEDIFLMRLLNNGAPLRTQPGLYRKINNHFAVIDALDDRWTRFSCGLVPCLVQASHGDYHPCLPYLVNTLTRIAQRNDATHDFVLDMDLFQNLSHHLWCHTSQLIGPVFQLVRNGPYYMDTKYIEPVVVVSIAFLVRRIPGTMEKCVSFLAFVLQCNADLRTAVEPNALELWRTGWPCAVGAVVAALLDTTSIFLVVHWGRARRLDGLLQAAWRHTHSVQWTRVTKLLAMHWPLECAASPCMTPTLTSAATTCPITLCAMVHPVVASDGHTYERDALMHHFVCNGMTSPMTRAPLSAHLFPNRALLR